MTVRHIGVWPVLFKKAYAVGQARLAYNAKPTEENKQALSRLEEDHKAYEDLCLQADDMIGLPDVSDLMRGY